ncbi:hypothetical protein MHYP_G00048860 [Metynnis hypsauchen]
MLIAKHCKPFTEGEFIKDYVMQMVEKFCPEKKQEFANLSLDRSTVARRIEEISSDIKRQLEAKGVEFDFFSLACDEGTDASDTAQLLTFLRGVDNDMNVSEELLDLQSLKDQTRGIDLFASVSSAVDDMKLQWNKITGIITDGAPAMAINYIRSRALCHRQFQQFLLDIHAEYGDVVYHIDIRWLSRGSALQRFYSLRKEIGQFLTQKGQMSDAGHL